MARLSGRRVAPGDGWPAHAEQLELAWGRAEFIDGDVVGAAEHVHADGSEPELVGIHAYFQAPVPEAVIKWFRDAFPDAQVRFHRTKVRAVGSALARQSESTDSRGHLRDAVR